MQRFILGLSVFALITVWPLESRAFVVINEVLADPASGAAGDANRDGVTSSTRDEFIELYNTGGQTVDISGWYLSDAAQTRHTFAANTLFSPLSVRVVFGGGSPQLPQNNWYLASSGGLSLNNTSETVSLFDRQGHLVDRIVYGSEGNHDQSLVRSPEGEGAFILHTQLPGASGQPFSAGYLVSPPDLPARPVPEPLSIFLLSGGIFTLVARHLKLNI